jgi:hypothetical protein
LRRVKGPSLNGVKRVFRVEFIDFKHFEDEITVRRSEIVVDHNVKLRKVI